MSAGLGTRLAPYTDHTPKPLLPLAGVPLFQWVVDQLYEAGIEKIFFNVHSHSKVFLDQVKNIDFNGLEFEWIDERKQLLGSGGTLIQVSQLIKDPYFLVINADALLLDSLRNFLKKAVSLNTKDPELFWWIHSGKNTKGSYSEIIVENDKVKEIRNKNISSPFFCGTSIVPAFYLRDFDVKSIEYRDLLMNPFLKKDKILSFESSPLFLDIGDPRAWWESHFVWMDEMKKQKGLPLWLKRMNQVNRCVDDGWVHREIKKVPKKGYGYWGKNAESDVAHQHVTYEGRPQDFALSWGGEISLFNK
ncbi:MAG: hypothetical protein CL678_11445 [Bdellovibrionaceae bacterium]|nr:hypothetical protein [Pseudobdellovibrionaceae bacterium]|tara:strand:+ start:938 stop:1849 length:912 start_codon:yes stop_codon:yes gene_type:complete